MSDYLIKAIAFEGKIRAYAVDTTSLVSNLQKNHDTWPTVSAALGRTATVGAMMGAMLKGNEKLTIQVNGNGPIGNIVVDANAKGEVRGYVENPIVELPLNSKGKLDVATAVGNGHIYVIKDLGLKEPYRGSVPIVSGEIGEDFTYYFAHSEQIPSAVGLGVLVNRDYSIKASGGFIIQVLPGLNDEDLAKLEEKINHFPPISKLIDEGMSPENILLKIFDNDVNILDRMEVHFKCNCSTERIENLLRNLGKEEIEDMIEKEGKAEVICQFCRTEYHFSTEQLQKIKNQL